MLKRAIVFSGGLAGIVFSVSAFCQTYEYVNVFNKRHTISIQISPAFFASGDRATDAEFCGRRDSFVCITSDTFNFAVPISKEIEILKWEHKGYSYDLMRKDTLEVLGQTSKVWIIESVQGVRKFRYLYSPKRGLLAVSIEVEGMNQTFLSTRAVGFGNQRDSKG